jgi:hypothetical protein
MSDTRPGTPRPLAATVVGTLALVGAGASLLRSLVHLGLPGLVTVLPAPWLPAMAVVFGLLTLLYAVTAYGALRLRGWAWPLGLTTCVLAFLANVSHWRGWWRMGLPALVALLAFAALVSRSARQALRD